MRNYAVRFPLAFTLAAMFAASCAPNATVESKVEPPPANVDNTPITVTLPQPEIGIQVGEPFSLDVLSGPQRFTDPRNTGLKYAITIYPSLRGLSVINGRIAGTPEEAGAVTARVRATDSTGRYAELSFPIFVFSNDLLTPTLPATPFSYADVDAPFPSFFVHSPTVVNADNARPTNAVTNAGAALGRVLFYDRRLSANDRTSCASCHIQRFAFGDTAALSRGFGGNVTARHSMPLTNVRFYRPARFFRDERAASLEQLVLLPISDEVEMGLREDFIAPKLRLNSFYRPLFAAAFGTPEITNQRVALALAQFVRSIASKNTKFDRVNNAEGDQFTVMESDGERIFIPQCRNCHESYAFVSDSVRNNGLDLDILDQGAGAGKFKAPSLRNVTARTRFMHDGRFRTIEEVIDFYDHKVANTPGLDRRLQELDGTPRKLNLTDYQKAALKAFLETLSDPVLLTDPKFSNPFR